MSKLSCRKVTMVRSDPGRGERTILSEVDCEFLPQQVGLVTGATGSGKSTLLHLLAGLLRPTAGEVFAGAAPVSRWVAGHRDRWRRDVGVALQAPNLLPELTVLENVMLPLVPKLRAADEARVKARTALEALEISPLAGASVGALSGGQKQRVALARAMSGGPKYLLADEPTSHQDAAGAQVVMRALSAARERGAAVVVTAHDPRLVDAPLADARWYLEGATLERR